MASQIPPDEELVQSTEILTSSSGNLVSNYIDNTQDNPWLPDNFYSSFDPFPRFPLELRTMIFKEAALAYADRIITTNIDNKPWKLIHATPQVIAAAKHLYIPFALGLVSKEARKAMFDVSTSHVFVNDRFKKTGSVRKLCFRPNDLLYITDMREVGQRSFDIHNRFHYLGFGNGIRNLLLPIRDVKVVAKYHSLGLVTLMRSLPDLKTCFVLMDWIAPKSEELHLRFAYIALQLQEGRVMKEVPIYIKELESSDEFLDFLGTSTRKVVKDLVKQGCDLRWKTICCCNC